MIIAKRLAIVAMVLMIALMAVSVASAADVLLTSGSSGQQVKELQQALTSKGFDPGSADGLYGPRTLAAVRAFQKSAGLAVDGVAGPKTLAALRGAGVVTVSRSSTASMPRTDLPLSGKTIVVDPGHGGANAGALGTDGSREADNVLAIGLKLRQLLVNAGAKVVMTRSANVEPKSPVDSGAHQLKARTDIANRSGADLFVSIHNNAYPQNPKVSGVMTFSRSGDATARKVSTAINQSLVKSIGWESRGIEYATFYVLRNTKMPAVLVEIGFMTNSSDVAALKTTSIRDKAAQGVLNGIIASTGKK